MYCFFNQKICNSRFFSPMNGEHMLFLNALYVFL